MVLGVVGDPGSVGLPGMLVVVPRLGVTDRNGGLGVGRVLSEDDVLSVDSERETFEVARDRFRSGCGSGCDCGGNGSEGSIISLG